jgi:hypothetical protein
MHSKHHHTTVFLHEAARQPSPHADISKVGDDTAKQVKVFDKRWTTRQDEAGSAH